MKHFFKKNAQAILLVACIVLLSSCKKILQGISDPPSGYNWIFDLTAFETAYYPGSPIPQTFRIRTNETLFGTDHITYNYNDKNKQVKVGTWSIEKDTITFTDKVSEEFNIGSPVYEVCTFKGELSKGADNIYYLDGTVHLDDFKIDVPFSAQGN